MEVPCDDYLTWMLGEQSYQCFYCQIYLTHEEGTDTRCVVDRADFNGDFNQENIVLSCIRCHVCMGDLSFDDKCKYGWQLRNHIIRRCRGSLCKTSPIKSQMLSLACFIPDLTKTQILDVCLVCNERLIN
jgi:hypothetical protein